MEQKDTNNIITVENFENYKSMLMSSNPEDKTLVLNILNNINDSIDNIVLVLILLVETNKLEKEVIEKECFKLNNILNNNNIYISKKEQDFEPISWFKVFEIVKKNPTYMEFFLERYAIRTKKLMIEWGLSLMVNFDFKLTYNE